MIETHGLTRRFAGVTAVDRLEVSVTGPGLVGFLGPNGAGKTTTLRMLAGYLAITDGTARVAGFDVFEQPMDVKARVGYQPETPPLHPELTVGEYLSWVAEIRGVSRPKRLSRVGEVMERVGLRGFERRLCGALSKGYRQRVALAQAILHDPAVLFLDEPTSGLDPAQLVGIRALIRELAVDRLVVLSTHLLVEVELLCSRVLLLHQGRLVGDGTVDALATQVGAGPWLELVADPAEDRSAALAALPTVAAVRRLGADRYRLEGECGPEVVALAASSGWSVRELTRHRASLEEVFLALVGVEA
jgi:ABC-2 type transport system ATP-binding protein